MTLPRKPRSPNGDNPLADVPAIVRKNTLFPAIQGKQFVVSLFELGQGWQAVNDAYGNPPVSTEQVLHPEKYFIQEAPLEVTVPDFSGLMSPGWSLTATDTLGEFVLRSYLEEHVSPSEAATAAAGWGGDQYLLLGHPELGRLALAQVVFDSVEDASEFHQTFPRLHDRRHCRHKHTNGPRRQPLEMVHQGWQNRSPRASASGGDFGGSRRCSRHYRRDGKLRRGHVESAIHAVNIIYITIASTMPDFITPRIAAGSRVDRMVTPFIDWARNYRHQHNNSPGDDNLQRGV